MRNKFKILIISLMLIFGNVIIAYADIPNETMVSGNVGISIKCSKESMTKIAKFLEGNKEFSMGNEKGYYIKAFDKWYDQDFNQIDKNKIPKIIYFDQNANSKIYEKCDGAEIKETDNKKKDDVKKDDDKKEEIKLETTQDIIDYLTKNYGELETSLGKMTFQYSVLSNDRDFIEYDYWIQTEFKNLADKAKFSDKDYTKKQKDDARKQLKDFQEKLGKDIMSKMKDKKFMGGYYRYWYKYPYSKVGLETLYYYTWRNYNHSSNYQSDTPVYDQAKAGVFRWYSELDSKL